ncbi:hypothetical protein [Ruminococcus sp.]|uniref:hypothetical protein n=1 Tax=Ruminococcus sp. TaxID=41978 RepID=UPI0025E02261|nr:hypothetical protein [Ruminococcus sp.]
MPKRKSKKQTKNQKKDVAIKSITPHSENEEIVNQDEASSSTDTENNIKEPVENAPIQVEDSYSIYEYMKNNTSFLIACASALVAIMTVFFKIGSYLYTSKYLNYWHIDQKLISTTETYWWEDIATSFILQILIYLFYVINFKSNNAYLCKKIYIKGIKNSLEKDKRTIHIIEKKLKPGIKGYKKIQAKIQDNKNKISEYKRKLRKFRLINFLLFAFNVLINMILTFFICLLLSRKTDSLYKTVFNALILMLILFLIIFIISKIYIKTKRKGINIKDNTDNSEEYPLITIATSSLKSLLSNNNIKILMYYFVVISSLFIISRPISGYTDAKTEKNISIALINNKEYALVYSNTDSFIAEKIEINGKNATVFVDEQIYIPKENIEIKNYKFDNVYRRKS